MTGRKTFTGEQVAGVKYGENPYQNSEGLYVDPSNTDPLAISNFELQGGSDPSFNNYADIDRLLQTMTHIAAGLDKNGLPVGYISLGAKHGNMCGAAVSDEAQKATTDMIDGDRTAIFGGLTMSNFRLDKTIADLSRWHGTAEGQTRLLDGVIAPGVDEEVLETMKRKGGKLRILTNQALGNLGMDSLDTAQRFRYVRGGFLVQDNYTYVPELTEEIPDTRGESGRDLRQDLILAWGVGCTSTSNTVTLVKEGMLIGNGVGQQDRVSAAQLAITRAGRSGHSVEGAVAYSDSFFPFPDGAQVLVDAGVSAVFTSSGSVNDEAVLDTFKRAGVAVFTVPDAEGRGFYGH